ncbi:MULTISPECIES: hypothetical protein [Acetobacteraceae]|nr:MULTISPECIES: hypothetical protein [Acetobacteraceae]MPV99255.1 hypothetical protein [Bombella apis]MUG78889.1 hypothetical protein [Bombella sp. ESL0380]
MKKLLFAAAAVWALAGGKACADDRYITAGVVTGVWRAIHDVAGAPELEFSSGREFVLTAFWVPPQTRSSPQKAGATLIIPGQYFDCSEKAVTLSFSNGDSLPLEGRGDCLPKSSVDTSRGTVLATKMGEDSQKDVAAKFATGAYPVSVIYGNQQIILHGSGFEAAASQYRNDIDPLLNPDFYDKFGISP